MQAVKRACICSRCVVLSRERYLLLTGASSCGTMAQKVGCMIHTLLMVGNALEMYRRAKTVQQKERAIEALSTAGKLLQLAAVDELVKVRKESEI